MVEFINNTYSPLLSCLRISQSLINGTGIFANNDLVAGQHLGVTHIWETNRIDWIRTPLGGFINHSDEPNCFIVTNIDHHHGTQRELYVVKPIKEGEELTIYYTLPEYIELKTT